MTEDEDNTQAREMAERAEQAEQAGQLPADQQQQGPPVGAPRAHQDDPSASQSPGQPSQSPPAVEVAPGAPPASPAAPSEQRSDEFQTQRTETRVEEGREPMSDPAEEKRVEEPAEVRVEETHVERTDSEQQ